MKKTIRYILRVSITFNVALSAFNTAAAQQGEGYNESVVVKGSYRPVIDQHTKLTFPAVISDSLGTMEHEFSYSISPSRLKALYEPSRIKAARIIGEPATRLYNNYLRLGFGNYWTPLADLYWSSTRDKRKTYGIRLNHLSSWDGLYKVGDEATHSDAARNYGPNHFGNTGVTLFGKYIVKDKLQLSADLGYEHDHNLYYGFNDSTLQAVMGVPRDSISISDYRASYNRAAFNFGLRNMQLDPNKLGYGIDLHASDLWALYGQNELNLSAAADVHYGFNIKDQYKGVAYLRIAWDGYNNRFAPDGTMPLGWGVVASPVAPGFVINPVPTDTVQLWRHIVKVNPYADFMLSGLQFHAGLTAGWDAYTDTIATFRLFPDVVVSKSLMKDALVLSLGATGGFDANSWNTIRQINPYVSPAAEQRATRHYDFTFHARWTFSRKLEANVEAAFQMLQDELTFKLDPACALGNLYAPLYLDNNRIVAGGTLTFVNDEMLTLRAGGHYYHYTESATDWSDGTPTGYFDMPYRPDWDALVAADVNYKDKWLFHLEGQLLGAMYAGNNAELPMRYGIAAEVEYRHNRALSFFLRMDNLAFQRYWLWQNYPSQRGLFLAGLTYTLN